ncbi:uncharacterized protein CDV56_102556 [Aspergillus thermomutatus]|uniref:GPI inositol-deacylase winged helix domain-containing protein n=1 Tax=Aspergillus thermomutatus TaxID=41047 RepID=A0A397G9Q5_ASPTH|nr:uncharacterized protein CDV56_102556 [Aspergillus thermomutatus]RHZ46624.1 hypothetical protein CDV56_102556 [Aspergillus thermomutatus]
MADPISILGLILQVAHTTKRVYDFAKQVRNADSEICELFGELFALKAILEQMQTDHGEKKAAQGPGSTPFRDALLKANTVLEESRLAKLGWPSRKGGLEGNIAQLERLKTYFILVILNDRSVVEKEMARSIDAVVDWSREMRQLREGSIALSAWYWSLIYRRAFPVVDCDDEQVPIALPRGKIINIQAFLNTQLTLVLGLRRLPEHIKCRIKKVLLEKASGMFRYVQCQIDLLSAQKTGRDVIRALESMPESLHGTYETILCRIPSYDREIARETLLWLSLGYQEITLSELSEALILTKGDKNIDDDCRLFDPHMILSICQGLIVYDERTLFVALAHSSVKAFLTSDAIKEGPAAYYSLDETEGSRRIWQKYLTYLMLYNFKQPCPNFRSLASRLEYPLLKYASENWASHCSPSWASSHSLIDTEIDEILSFFNTRHLPDGGNYTSWVQVLLYEAPAAQALRTEPLYYAASYGIVPLVDRLIRSGGRNNATPLIVACYRGQTATVQRLLEAGADPTIQDAVEMCSLEWAIRRQQRDIVDTLLSHMYKSMEMESSGLYWQCRSCRYQNPIGCAVQPCASCGNDFLDRYGTRSSGSSASRTSRAWSRIGRTSEPDRGARGHQVSSES